MLRIAKRSRAKHRADSHQLWALFFTHTSVGSHCVCSQGYVSAGKTPKVSTRLGLVRVLYSVGYAAVLRGGVVI